MTISTAEAAALAGMTYATFRREMSRQRSAGRDFRLPRESWIDQRTPLWDRDKLEAWLASRPGRGNWGRRNQTNERKQ